MSLGFVSSHCTLYGTRFGLQRNIRTSRKRVVGPLAKPRMLLDILPLHESVNQLHYAAPMYLSSESGGMVVQEGGYLAVLLGVLIPVAFLIILYIQSEARNAGARNE
jgi:photosystem II reaction center protein PsbM